ncbi:MAG: L-rhamnose/proton symporter RhaT [Bacteroidota bacterium]
MVFGIFLIATGTFSAGSFAVPFGRIKGWQWKTYWMVFSFGGYIILPFISGLIFAPDWLDSIKSTPTNVLVFVFLLGMVYGIGNLSFGLSLRGYVIPVPLERFTGRKEVREAQKNVDQNSGH